MPNYGNSNLKVSDAITVAEVGGTPDAYPTHYAFLGKGGWRSAASLSALNSTSSQRLEAGCAGYVWNDSGNNGLYVWNGSTWVKTSLSPTAYSLPAATTSVRGGVIIKSGGSITLSGTNSDEIDVQKASSSDFGVVKIGSGLAIDVDNKLYVTAANLTVKGPNSYSQSSPVLTFAGTAPKLTFNTTPDPDENTVTIDLPRYKDDAGTTIYSPNLITFSAGSNVTLSRTYSTSGNDNIYNLQIDISSNGTFKQNLYELGDILNGIGVTGSVQTPSDGQVLKYSNSQSKWIAATHNTGIQFSDLVATAPLVFDTTTNSGKGTYSIPRATTSANGYLHQDDFDIFNDKQDKLVNTVNIKSINGTSLLGSGNIVISGGGGGTVTSVAALTIGSSGTDITSTVANGTTTPVITLNIPTAASDKRGVITGAMYDEITKVANKLDVTANTNAGSGTSITLDFSLPDTIYGSVGSGSAVTGNISVSTTSGKVGVTHIVVHNSSTIPTITGALKLSGSGNYKPSVNNYIYFTYISGTTVIYSINQAS